MGVEYRDYMSGSPSNRFRGGAGKSMVTILIIVNCVIFAIQAMTGGQLLERWFALDPDDILRGQIWRLTTYDFLHDTSSIWHLLFNMWLLFLAGRRVEMRYGSQEFLAFYLLAGILSGVVFLIWGLATGSHGSAIGASGAAVAVMIVYAMNWPGERWYLWGILPIPVYVLALIGAGFDLLPMLQQLQGNQVGDGIAHSAHVGGMLFGFLYVRFGWRILNWAPKGGMKNLLKRRPKLRVHSPAQEEPVRPAAPPSEELSSRVDALLEKITEKGEGSLTDEERRFLSDASRRYRNRH